MNCAEILHFRGDPYVCNRELGHVGACAHFRVGSIVMADGWTRPKGVTVSQNINPAPGISEGAIARFSAREIRAARRMS